MGRWGLFFVSVVAFVLAGVASARAQSIYPIKIRPEYDIDDNVVLWVDRVEKGFYTLVLDFNGSENMAVPKLMRFDVKTDGPLVTLRPANREKRWHYTYNQSSVPGVVNPPEVDSAFVYRLPFSASANRMAHHFQLTEADSVLVNYSEIGFKMNRGDTIFAARQGLVIGVVDKHEPIVSDGGQIIAGRESNAVSVMHADGTIARYGTLLKGSIPVKVGDMVYSGDQIGLAGSFDNKFWQLRFHIFYQTDNLYRIKSVYDYRVYMNYLVPIFATSKGKIKLANDTYYTH
jgi:murein DD-endopeptidase MepM/ murein hydrolase activator NlpD